MAQTPNLSLERQVACYLRLKKKKEDLLAQARETNDSMLAMVRESPHLGTIIGTIRSLEKKIPEKEKEEKKKEDSRKMPPPPERIPKRPAPSEEKTPSPTLSARQKKRKRSAESRAMAALRDNLQTDSPKEAEMKKAGELEGEVLPTWQPDFPLDFIDPKSLLGKQT